MSAPRHSVLATGEQRKRRLFPLAIALGLTAPMALATQANAAKIEGEFGGSAKTIGITGVSDAIRVSLHNAAAEGCPCRGTRGMVETKTTASIDAPGILSVQTTIATAYGAKTRAMATTSQSATVTGLKLLGGLITADALVSVATVDATAEKLTKDDAGTTITNLVVNGTPIDAGVPDNTVVTLPGLGTVTIKAVEKSITKQKAFETVDMLLIEVGQSNSFGLPVGAKITVAHANASYDRQQPVVAMSGGASGLHANAAAGTALDEAAGSAGSIGIPNCSGTDGKTLERSVTDLSAGSLLTIGTITNTAFGGTQGKQTVVATSSTASDISLLGGLIGAKSIAAFAQESSTGGADTPSTQGSGFVGLTIAGLPVDSNTPPNTTLTLPGIGSVTVNEQLLGATSAVQVNGLHIKVTVENALLPLGAQVIVAHAASVARRF